MHKKMTIILRRALQFMAVLALVVMLVPIQSVNAADEIAPKCDEDFYMSNNILYYNPCQDFCTATPGASTGKIATLNGANNAEKIYNFWVTAGLTSGQSAGVTGSMKHEGGFSPFRQEMSKSWPNGGWGIAQFTFDPGQRGEAKAYVSNEVGAELFNQYYQPSYGGAVYESDGYIPAGVPQDVNDKFLLAQLNYLLEHVQGLKPNNTRTGAYSRDFNKTIDGNTSLYEHLKALQSPAEAAIAWTYLYEFPGDIKNTSLERGTSADELAALFSGGTGTTTGNLCGSVSSGGLNMQQAQGFMENYKAITTTDHEDAQYLTAACHTLTDNCVTFSAYFVNKYTSAKFGINNGVGVVNSTVAANPSLKTGKEPKAFALFSTAKGDAVCEGGEKCGHTGIILGVDAEKKTVIVGEAAYCNPGFTGAREYPLADFSNGDYTYAYLDGVLKGSIN